MGEAESCRSAERLCLEGELKAWFRRQGVSEAGGSWAVELLDAPTLLSQPRPGKWNRRGDFGFQARCRYLWYRHAAKILGWCERKPFPELITGILRDHIFPDSERRDEAPSEDVQGGVSASPQSRPSHLGAAHQSTGM